MKEIDTISFRDLVMVIQGKSKELLASDIISTPMKHQIETTMQLIYDIKDNKITRNEYNQNMKFERLSKLVKAYNEKHNSSMSGIKMTMNFGYNDIINIPKMGRWWLSGAPVKGNFGTTSNNSNTNKQLSNNNNNSSGIWANSNEAISFSNEMIAMARAFRMNTPFKKAVFCIVMGSEDYVEAFDKLLQLNLHSVNYNRNYDILSNNGRKQKRIYNNDRINEMVRIILLLSIRQKNEYFNPYYHLLLGKISKHSKGWKFSLQCALWDKFQEIETMTASDVSNLAILIGNLLFGQCLTLIVLKNLELMKPSPKNVLFVNTVLVSIFENALKNGNIQAAKQVVTKIFDTLTKQNTNALIKSLNDSDDESYFNSNSQKSAKNQDCKLLQQELEIFLISILIPRGEKQLQLLKDKYKKVKLLSNVKETKKNANDSKKIKDKLSKLVLKITKKQEFVALANTALDCVRNVNVTKSSYDDMF